MIGRVEKFGETLERMELIFTRFNTSETSDTMNENMLRLDRSIAELFKKIEKIEQRPPQKSPQHKFSFTPEIVAQARDQLGLDLDQELVNSLIF